MRIDKTLQKAVHSEFTQDPAKNAAEKNFSNKLGKQLKKIVFAASLAGIAIIFNGCSAGYVASEPAYMQYDRPAQPSNLSIWIDGDWNWNSRSQQYYQRNGYWDNPRPGRTYTSGHWHATPKGKTWSKGYWQSDGNNKNRNKHNHNHNQDTY